MKYIKEIHLNDRYKLVFIESNKHIWRVRYGLFDNINPKPLAGKIITKQREPEKIFLTFKRKINKNCINEKFDSADELFKYIIKICDLEINDKKLKAIISYFDKISNTAQDQLVGENVIKQLISK